MTQIPYDDDILAWSERQAEALRRRSANELDWDNIAEEIESVGRNEFHAVSRCCCRRFATCSKPWHGRSAATHGSGKRKQRVPSSSTPSFRTIHAAAV